VHWLFWNLPYQEETEQGDVITIIVPPKPTIHQVLERATCSILSGERESIALVPDDTTFCALSSTVLPRGSIVVPGSFNPPHRGHVHLANAALEATESNIVWFELSITNVDKPSLKDSDIVQRLEAFLTLSRTNNFDTPKQWGVLLTNAPLFQQKVNVLRSCLLGNKNDEPLLNLVVGTDTLVRIVNPKYYESLDKMIETLQTMPCRFVVGGRLLDQTTTFVSAQEIVDGLPEQLRSKCLLLSDFRVDVSSTELRKRINQDDDSP
jgi:nicotinic acid mononucleotide adenylyltransferase